MWLAVVLPFFPCGCVLTSPEMLLSTQPQTSGPCYILSPCLWGSRLGNGRWLLSRGLAYESVIRRLLAGLVWPQAGQPRQAGFVPLVLYSPAGQSTCVLLARAELHEQPGPVTQALSGLHCFMHANFPPAETSHMSIPTGRVRGTAKLYGPG